MLKNKILNNTLIKELISDPNTLAVYLGGSRLLNLELSNSDYDIIVVSKNKAIQGLFGAYIEEFEQNTIHLQTVYFYNILKALDNSNENMKSIEALSLLQFIWPDIDYLYRSEEYKLLQTIFNKHYSKLCILSLENLLDSLSKPEKTNNYTKSKYHYICFNFILNNYKLTDRLFLTNSQKELLKQIKSTKVIPTNVLDSLVTRNSRQHLFYYNYYKEVYQEVITCQKKFI